MKIQEDLLAFVVRFAQVDLGQLQPEDWRTLRNDLKGFLRGNPDSIREDKKHPWAIVPRSNETLGPSGPSEEELRTLQRELQEVLGWIFEIDKPNSAIPVRGTRPRKVQLDYSLWLPGRARYFFVEGPTQEVFLFAVHLLLVRGADTFLRQCPECKTIFVRDRKQQYCSRSCVKRANMRVWRRTPKGKAAQARSSRVQYERKLKRRFGPKVKIATRPRKSHATDL